MFKKRKVLIYIAAILLFILIILFLYYYRVKIGKIFMPFLMAGIISYLLGPLVIRLEKRRVSRSLSILLIYLAASILTTSIIVFIIPEVINNTKDLMNTLPSITSKYQTIIDNTMSAIEASRWTPDVKNAIFREVQNGLEAAQAFIMTVLKKSLVKTFEIVTAMFDVILAMIIAYYFIKDAEFFKTTFLYFTPKRWRNGIIASCREINGILSNFIQGQLLTAIIVSAMESLGLYLINVKYPLVLGIVGGVANIIPYFGPLIGAVPALAVALIQSPVKAVWTAVVFIVVQQIDNAFISPKIIEGKLGLHPVTTILAVLIGGEFFGIPGMLVSVPILAIIKIILKRIIEAVV
jgi:predicted PurR-regulated permease PerM